MVVMMMMILLLLLLITVIIMMIIIIIVVMAFKRAIRDFLHSPQCAANSLQPARSSGPGAIVCKSRARQIVYHVQMPCATWFEGTAQQSSLSLNHIYLSLILLAEPLTDEGVLTPRPFHWPPLVLSSSVYTPFIWKS